LISEAVTTEVATSVSQWIQTRLRLPSVLPHHSSMALRHRSLQRWIFF